MKQRRVQHELVRHADESAVLLRTSCVICGEVVNFQYPLPKAMWEPLVEAMQFTRQELAARVGRQWIGEERPY